MNLTEKTFKTFSLKAQLEIISASGTTAFFRAERFGYNICNLFGVIRLWWAVKNFRISPQEEEVGPIAYFCVTFHSLTQSVSF